MPMLLVLLVQFARHVLPPLMDSRSFQPYAIDPGQMTLDTSTFEESEFEAVEADTVVPAGEAEPQE
jgi:hypothetical protein